MKVTAHHGLLTTEKIPSSLGAKEKAVYDMIAFRLLEALSGSCSKEITDITLEVLHCDFMLKSFKILQPGWRAVKGNFSEEEAEPVQDLPSLKVGEEIKIRNSVVLEKKTAPPALFTEVGLLSAMENVGKEIENEEERKILHNVGIGTPATRASIIETLFKRNYINKEKKSLIPTEKGLQVYDLVKDKKIADAVLTAEWELALQKIENNEADAGVFQKEMERYSASITAELLETQISRADLPSLICPKCKRRELIIREKIVKCPDDDCRWVQFRNICGVQVSIKDIESLLSAGKTALIKGMKTKAGKKFNAFIVLNDQAETSFESERTQPRKKK